MNNKIKANFNKVLTLFFLLIFLNQCGMGADARKYPPEPSKRVQKNLEEGRGFRLSGGEKKNRGGDFEFASSNPLWKASLDTIDFMPLASANYSGGIIITDWYSSENSNESIKVSIRFLSNEVRSDALDIKVFYKKCSLNENCAVTEKTGKLANELNKKILQKAAVYQKQIKEKNFKPYKVPGVTK
tara:strand:- start:969 stop:1526 length:558 start_codon:yes stop_codon:yes gene_type:complete